MDIHKLPRRLLLARGIEIRRGPHLIHFLQSREIDLVLDVGANVGQFARRLRRHGYRGDIVSFEPIMEIHDRLARAASADPRWATRPFALGRADEERSINVSELSVFSSILPLTKAATDFDPRASVTRTEQIKVVRLDGIFDDFAGRRVFLKVDAQGFEPEILAGAAASMPRILGVLLELPVENLYAGTWTLEEAIAAMRAYGFLPAQINPVNHMTSDKVAAIEFDCLFRRIV